jgi:hypothetical protein
VQGSGRGHERTTTLRRLFEGGGPSAELTRAASGSLPSDRPDSPSVRQRIQELADAAAAQDRPPPPAFSNLRPRPRTEPAQGLSLEPRPARTSSSDSEPQGSHGSQTGPQAESAELPADPRVQQAGAGPQHAEPAGVTREAESPRALHGGPPGSSAQAEAISRSRAPPLYAPEPSSSRSAAGRPSGEEPQGHTGSAAFNAGAETAPSGRTMTVRPREAVAFLEAYEREVVGSPFPRDAHGSQQEPAGVAPLRRTPPSLSAAKEAFSFNLQVCSDTDRFSHRL